MLTLDAIAELRENRTVAAMGISPPIGREAEWTRLLEFLEGHLPQENRNLPLANPQ